MRDTHLLVNLVTPTDGRVIIRLEGARMVPRIVRRVQPVVRLLLRQRHLRAGARSHRAGPQQAQPSAAGFHLLGMGGRGCGGSCNARRCVRVRVCRAPL